MFPSLPATSADIDIPAQPARPGEPRSIRVYIRYPAGALAAVKPTTGLMLSLHNWGGYNFCNAPDPVRLADTLDVVAIGVDYYQSGDADKTIPYDYGCLQAMDALRALYFVFSGLLDTGIAFDKTRLYSTGGSGGGNVSEMVNKFAPRTFACIVDLSGVVSLSPAAGSVFKSARYSADPASPHFASPDMIEIRDAGNPRHLELMKKLGNCCRVIMIHGEDDPVCLAADCKRAAEAMRTAGLEVEPHFVAAADVDGKLFIDSGHQIGDRTALLLHFAAPSLSPGSPALKRLTGPCDFERREILRYPTSNGAYDVSYAEGFPELTFSGGE